MVKTVFCEFGSKKYIFGVKWLFFHVECNKNFILTEKNKFTNLIVMPKYSITI